MSETKRPLKVFLCYAHSDVVAVRTLYSRLKQEGIDVWFDKEKLIPGSDWELEIRQAVRDANVVIVCLSKQFNQAGFRQKEVRWSLDTAMEQPEGEIFIIPTRLEECDTLASLKKWHWVDLHERDGYERLLFSLRTRATRIGVPLEVNQALPVKANLELPFDVSGVKSKKSLGKANLLSNAQLPVIVILIGLTLTIILNLLSPIGPNFAPTPSANTNQTSSTQEAVITNQSTNSVSTSTVRTAKPIVVRGGEVSIVRSFPAPGQRAEGLTWDGTNLWLSDNSGSIFKVDTSGQVLDSFMSPEVTPQGITWDGANFWIFTTNYSFIYQFQIAGESVQTVSSFQAPAEVLGGGITQDMAWDGRSLWFANQYKVTNLSMSGEQLGSFVFEKNISGLDWDGTNLWFAYNGFPGKGTLFMVSTDGDVLGTYPSPIFEIICLAWADRSLWALGLDLLGGSHMIYQLSISHN